MNENQIKIFNYNGNPITFQSGNGVMVNATQMAKNFFGKSPKYWLRNQQTKEFLAELSEVRNLTSAELVKVTYGDNGGTWFHEDVALEFARWLSPKFAIWCNDRIKELLTQGYAAIGNMSAPPSFDMLPTAVFELQKTVNYLVSMVENMAAQPQTALIAPLGKGLILGRFRPGERIRMKDHRLYEGPGAPFPSYNQVLHAKRRGCPFTRPDDVRIWSITAESLEDWFNNPQKYALPILKA